MRTEIVEVYTFDELSSEARERAIEDARYPYYEIAVDLAYEDMKYRLGEISDGLDVQFDFSCCQGSGVNIYGKVPIYEAFDYLSNTGLFEDFTHEERVFLENCADTIEYAQNYRYTYSLKDYVNGVDFDFSEYNDDEARLLERVCLCLTGRLEQLEGIFYDEWRDYPSDDDIADYLSANEYEFDVNGKVW